MTVCYSRIDVRGASGGACIKACGQNGFPASLQRQFYRSPHSTSPSPDAFSWLRSRKGAGDAHRWASANDYVALNLYATRYPRASRKGLGSSCILPRSSPVNPAMWQESGKSLQGSGMKIGVVGAHGQLGTIVLCTLQRLNGMGATAI